MFFCFVLFCSYFHSATLFVFTMNPSQILLLKIYTNFSISSEWNAFYKATTLILNRILSAPLKNSFPAWGNTQKFQKSRDSSRHFRVSLLVKSCISLTFSSNKQCGVWLWLSQVEIFLLSEQASEKLTRYSNKITSRFENWMPSAAQLNCARLSREKIPVNVNQ